MAAITCSIAAQSLSVLYVSTANADGQANLTVTCNRLSTDANKITYRVYVDNGLYATPSGSLTAQRRGLRSGSTGSYINYGIYRNSTRTQDWRFPPTGTTNVATGTINFGASTSKSATHVYYLRVPSGQTGATTGNYLDSLNTYVRYPNADTGTLSSAAPISLGIAVGSQCIFSTTPGNIAMSYTSFRPNQLNSTTAFTKTCTSGLAYSIALSPTSGSALGLSYTLSVSSPSGSGNGSAQSHTITANMPAGQSGNCSVGTCTATLGHTVTITY